jgi:NAD-dependent dihydropyrimidine dehydrogenase PreA subunit
MIKKVIKIDEDKCIGCSLCAQACQEGAIGMVDGKAKLLRDDYCDGLGNCLPVCPTNAISFEEREVEQKGPAKPEKHGEGHGHENGNGQGHGDGQGMPDLACGCPGSQAKTFRREESNLSKPSSNKVEENNSDLDSQLRQWPCQIKLVPVNAPYFEGANLLIAADCCAFAYGDFHRKFMKNKITLIGCPKLDEGDYSEKLTAIIKNNNLKSITVLRMEVPCCAGIVKATQQAILNSGKMPPWSVVTISTDGKILED